MAKYSKAAGKKVGTAMTEMKKGSLKTGTGKKVTDKKQAIAIGLSEAKKKGAKVPAKKAAPSKVAVKKSAPKKAVAKKAAPKKAPEYFEMLFNNLFFLCLCLPVASFYLILRQIV